MKSCLTCAAPTRFGRARCDSCSATHNAAVKAAYHERAGKEQCPKCGGPPKTGRKQCQPCRDKLNAQHRAWRAA